jgi:LmbE family N-acetylglucosaminyl deacetylase
MKKKIKSALIVVAHRDDEILGCGGTIAKLIEDKYKVYAISMTNGVSSRVRSSKKEIDQRYKNSLKAAKLIGFNWLNKISGDFADNAMDSEPLLNIVKIIEKAKKITNPEIVITHYPEDLNIDHQIVSSATLTAFRPKTNQTCKKIISFEVPSSTDFAIYKKNFFKPNYFVDIQKFWNKKKLGLDAYKDEMLKYPNSRSLKGLKNLAHYRGNQVGLNMAEAFQILRIIK